MLRKLATILQKTDYRRWSNDSSFDPSWEPRTKRAAELVPIHSRVIEFGAGQRRLEKHLHSSCTYVPSDVIDRGPGTIVCDLNERPLPNLRTGVYDVAVILGVFEYLHNVPEVIDWLAKQVRVCVLSYVCMEVNRFSLRGVRQALGRRLGTRWMNNYSEDQLRSLFQERGFEQLSVETCIGNRLFVFAQRP